MDDNKLRFGVGVLVIAAIGIGVILTFLFGAFPAILNREYTLSVEFPSAEGINTNTPVLRDGVKIGRVSDIRLLDEGGVVLTLGIQAEHKMSHEYIPQIGIGSLITGDSKLEFRKAEPSELQEIFKSGTDIIRQPYSDGEKVGYGIKLKDPFSLVFGMEDELRSTFQSVRGAGDSVQQVGKSINTLVNDVRGLIGTDPTVHPAPPTYPPRDPQQSSSGGTDPRALAARHGGGMPPAPSWARPVVFLTSANEDGSAATAVETVAFLNPAPSQGQFPAPTGPPRSLQPGMTPPLGRPQPGPPQPGPPQPSRPQPGGLAPRQPRTLLDLQNEAFAAVKEFREVIANANAVLADPHVSGAISRFPGMLDDASMALNNLADAGRQFEQVGSVAEQALQELKISAGETLDSFQATAKNVEAITDPIARHSEDLVQQFLRSLAHVDNALIQIDTFGQTLNQSDGTVRRLLEDDELYYEIRRTVENIEAATARVRPILDDVRVFTDKIARDPRQLGIRGALGNRPTGAGLK